MPDDVVLDCKRRLLTQLLSLVEAGSENEELYLNVNLIITEVSAKKPLYQILTEEDYFNTLLGLTDDRSDKKVVSVCKIINHLLKNLREMSDKERRKVTSDRSFMDDDDDVIMDEESSNASTQETAGDGQLDMSNLPVILALNNKIPQLIA